MAKILFLVHRIPYPPNKGDKIRSWNFLRHLCETHEVHAGFFVDDPADIQHVKVLEEHCRSVHWSFASPMKQKLASLRGFLNGRCLTEMAYPSAKLREGVKQVLDRGIDCVFLYSAASRAFLPKEVTVPIITDFVDVDSAKWEAYAAQKSGPLSAIYHREARLLARYEHNLARESATSVFVSGDEAALFRERLGAPSSAAEVFGIPNGVDTEAFDPDKYQGQRSAGKRVLFTGAMDYAPNVDAVEWFVRDIFPAIRRAINDVEFFVAGRPVAPAVKALGTEDGVTVLGGVDDMAAEIAKADVVVAPLRTARGIQNKVLEGMAMAKPVVCTSAANEGINAVVGESIIVADEVEAFAESVIDLLNDPKKAHQISQNARRFVQQFNSWEAAFSQLDTVISDALSDKGGQGRDVG